MKKSRLLMAVTLFLVMSFAWAHAGDATDPSDYDNRPLKAGDLTLEDVLEAHTVKPPSSISTLTQPLPPSSPTAAPTMAPVVKPSSEGSMLMQGMKMILEGTNDQSTSSPAAPNLAATQPKADTQGAAAAPTPSGVDYVPGQEPKNLAMPATTGDNGGNNTAATTPAPSTDSAQPTVSPSDQAATIAPPPSSLKPSKKSKTKSQAAASQPKPTEDTSEASANDKPTTTASTTPSASSANCDAKVVSWTRKCTEAGYPDSFTGEIKGETRTTCPDGTLQDVWVSNSCAPPDDEQQGAATKADDANKETPKDKETPDVSQAAASTSTTTPMPAAPSSSDRLDASCGTANGMAAASAPTSDLCAVGEATPLSGTGPWLWNCKGPNGGMTVSCAAPLAVAKPMEAPKSKTVAGRCGKADGVGIDHTPDGDLCEEGNAGKVSGDGPWTWTCSGQNGGDAAGCKAPKISNGVCGSAVGAGATKMPADNLCTSGYASAVTGDGPWNWTCSGLNGGTAATCTAGLMKDGVCGEATQGAHTETPNDNLCSVGHASAVSGKGPWLWACAGVDGGESVTCSAIVSVKSVCGSASGVAVAAIPTDNLCSQGHASNVEGQGPWTWKCISAGETDGEKCSAPLLEASATHATSTDTEASDTTSSGGPSVVALAEKKMAEEQKSPKTMSAELCGAASELAAFERPSKDLCKEGDIPSSVTGEGPWTWSCADGLGHSSLCSTLSPGSMGAAALETEATPVPSPTKPVELKPDVSTTAPSKGAVASGAKSKATCGSSADKGTTEKPKLELCDVGKASKVKGKGPWTWTCAKGKSKISCEAPVLIDAVCGSSNGKYASSSPTENLCFSGEPSNVVGDGPWTWTCAGVAGGASITCSAAVKVNNLVDGKCGIQAGTFATEAPSGTICASGLASAVNGDGPWTWTCSGINGGTAALCATQKIATAQPSTSGPVVNGLCGAASGAAMISQPTDGLCAAGTATKMTGDGPWNWSCLGENGGMTVSCTSPLQPPSPIVGACGSASGVPTLSAPGSGLCSAGIGSAVSGHGPWTWSCSGINGGGAVACVAPVAGGGGGSMPSLVTPSSNASPHASSPSSGGLVTPQVTAPAIPKSSSNFASPPVASEVPSPPTLDENGIKLPNSSPSLPADAVPLPPPAVRDTIKSSQALQSQGLDGSTALNVVNRYVLSDDDTVVTFDAKSDVLDEDAGEALDRLVVELKGHPYVRITLSSYANSNHTTPREARRLSLSRAVSVRDYLMARGIASSRIDVRALGANVTSGNPDRVDIVAN